MEKIILDDKMILHDCSLTSDNQSLDMILRSVVEDDGSITFCCIRQSDPYIDPLEKHALKALNEISELSEIKYNLIGNKLLETYNLKSLYELPQDKKTLLQKIKSIFTVSNA